MARSRYGRLLVSRYTSSLEWEALYQEGCAAVVRWPRRVPLDDRGFLAFMSVAVRNEFRQAYAQAARRAARATMEPYFEGTDRPSDGSGPRPEEEE